MKFQVDRLEGVNAITRVGTDSLRVNSEEFSASVLVPWRGPVRRWGVQSFELLSPAHFQAVAGMEPEIVIFGSGRRLRFARVALLAALIDRRIGVETMDHAAACRTYNVLAAEGRNVVAALLIEAQGNDAISQ